VQDCTYSRQIWQLFSFNDPIFFSNMEVHDWLKVSSMGSQTFIFSACIWWACRHRNLMCLNNETWSLNRLSFNIQSMMDNLKICFVVNSIAILDESQIKWNKNNHSCTILNTDGSCMGPPLELVMEGGFEIVLAIIY